MVQYEVCWPIGSASTGRAPHQLTGSPFKYLKDNLKRFRMHCQKILMIQQGTYITLGGLFKHVMAQVH